ncbi:MAG: hypothetical protein HYZ45_14900 [Burkholderiales bacterium]|nr:hypothetical protein [Burkholderiales bacterium]
MGKASSGDDIDTPIFAMTPSIATQRKVALFRNVRAYNLDESPDREAVLAAAEKVLFDKGAVKRGDTLVVTWGEPMGQVGGTNAMKIVKVGES